MNITTKYELGDVLVDNAGDSGVVTGMKVHNFEGRCRVFYFLDYGWMEYFEENLNYVE